MYEALAASGLVDAIVARTRLPASAVPSLLLSLELKGLVRCVAGRYERRVGSKSAEPT